MPVYKYVCSALDSGCTEELLWNGVDDGICRFSLTCAFAQELTELYDTLARSARMPINTFYRAMTVRAQ